MTVYTNIVILDIIYINTIIVTSISILASCTILSIIKAFFYHLPKDINNQDIIGVFMDQHKFDYHYYCTCIINIVLVVIIILLLVVEVVIVVVW